MIGIATVNFGQAQSKLANFQEEYAESMRNEYIEKLDEGLQQFKEYQALRKKLESRRLDYDSKLSRLQKSKKENPGLEQELQAAKMKFEDSEYDVIQKMASLQEFEV
jgi:cell shape-determining protein MreC